MPDSIDTLMQSLPLTPLQAYALLALVAALIVALIVFRERITWWRENRQIHRVLQRLGAREIRNFTLADGTGGEVQLDHLLLTREGVLVVGIKRFSGLIFGGPKMDQWTQVINRVSYKFANPDDYLQRQINAVRSVMPGNRVLGIHLFTHCAHFPKDKPENVLTTRDLRKLPKRPRMKDIPAGLRTAWQELAGNIARK